jgi:hypothetical protein
MVSKSCSVKQHCFLGGRKASEGEGKEGEEGGGGVELAVPLGESMNAPQV